MVKKSTSLIHFFLLFVLLFFSHTFHVLNENILVDGFMANWQTWTVHAYSPGYLLG
jgi:hypothetical protein